MTPIVLCAGKGIKLAEELEHKKIRDVQREREDAIFNKFWTILNDLKYFFNFYLFCTIMIHFEQFSWTFLNFARQNLTISKTIKQCLTISYSIKQYLMNLTAPKESNSIRHYPKWSNNILLTVKKVFLIQYLIQRLMKWLLCDQMTASLSVFMWYSQIAYQTEKVLGKKFYDWMLSLESDQMTALWPNDSFTFTF